MAWRRSAVRRGETARPLESNGTTELSILRAERGVSERDHVAGRRTLEAMAVERAQTAGFRQREMAGQEAQRGETLRDNAGQTIGKSASVGGVDAAC